MSAGDLEDAPDAGFDKVFPVLVAEPRDRGVARTVRGRGFLNAKPAKFGDDRSYLFGGCPYEVKTAAIESATAE